MDTTQSVPERVAAAQAAAKPSEDRIAEIFDLGDAQTLSVSLAEDLRAATVALELATVDIYSAFESQMQHHFKRGPFSRKLKNLLIDAGKTDLADRVHHYYLAANVLKHGKGASHRELLNAPTSLYAVKAAQDAAVDDDHPATGLIDVTGPDFFAGLTKTILEAYQFLEKK
ncbi:hypothetical protein DS909_20955 [Phaeobacter gallaeciensis]|uniref:Uncharacterized protein n=2 Tax=Roseobacteraceae TaxID=2854170 RepID=A0A366WR50_9RHOB|nr:MULTISPECIES: hypothetical protein [Roseobacteraceae]MBT3141407.1 hypothetical protein [Falsiruegeria litorea]MBT8167451.1 hypothetical protein [Falsiruegeria litorea]RBW51019.1 hypothetical protein DS909_20955 [Phaeobacter gallaeciensis]